MIVLDTSALIFWTFDRANLSPNAERAISQSAQIMISSISIWEIGLKVKNGKLDLPLRIDEYVDNLRNIDRVELVAVTETIWLKNLELGWGHKDPADRTIVAQAMILDCPLVTADQRIRDFYKMTIW